MLVLSFFEDFIYLFLERGEGKEKERERRGTLTCPFLGTWPPTQACALTGNQTSDPLVCRSALNPLSCTNQGMILVLRCIFQSMFAGPEAFRTLLWGIIRKILWCNPAAHLIVLTRVTRNRPSTHSSSISMEDSSVTPHCPESWHLFRIFSVSLSAIKD